MDNAPQFNTQPAVNQQLLACWFSGSLYCRNSAVPNAVAEVAQTLALVPLSRREMDTMIDSRRRLIFPMALLFVVASGVAPSPAQEESLKPGLNESYKTIDIENVIKRFEGEKRDVVVKRDEILAACELKPGMMVADVGAGTGLFTRPMAAKLAPKGKVFAVDVTEQFIERVKQSCREEGLENVDGILSTPTSTELPAESVDGWGWLI